MSLINAPSTQAEPILLSGPASPIEITLKDLQNSISNEKTTPAPFSQTSGTQSLFKDLPSEKSTDLEEDPDLIIYDSIKKPTMESKTANMLRPESGNSGHELQGKGVNKSSDSQSWKPANTGVHPLKTNSQEKIPFKKSDENSFTCGPNLINASKQEIINLEDDEDEPVETEKTQTSQTSIQLDNLIMNDPYMNGLVQNQEQMLRQMILKNMMNQAGLMQRQQQLMNPAQKAYMAAAQFAQMGQMAQRGYGNPFGNMTFFGGNPAMMPQFSANYNFNPLMNQGAYPNMLNRFQDNSLLGKRNEPLDGFGNQNERQVLKVNKLDNNQRSEVIVLEDEAEDKENKITASIWQAIQLRKKIFTVEKIPRKYIYKRPASDKKQVFTIIRQKKRSFIRTKPFRQTKYLIHAQNKPRKLSIVEKKETLITQVDVNQNEIEVSKRTSKILRKEVTEIEEYEDARLDMNSDSEFSEETPCYDNYTIKLHIDENDDNEDIVETPVGNEFQIKLLPFRGKPKAKRSIKSVWNPEMIDQEVIESCFKEIEDEFDREIVSEESALKILKKFEMNVDKVAEELDANKIAYKSLFTIRQKILRSRIFNH